MKKTLRNIDIAGKRLLVRVDYNVPQEKDGSISSDRRVRASLPTIQHALSQGCAIVLMSHLGRPKGDPAKDAKFKMDVVAERLRALLPGVTVNKSDEVVGPKTTELANKLQPGQILLLENLRFHPEEQKPTADFAKQLRKLADVYVNDAFGTCHRQDASMYAVPVEFPKAARCIGFLVEKELQILELILGKPKTPMVAIMGGAKVSDKIQFIKKMLERVDKLCIGGAMTYTFLLAQGKTAGNSLVEQAHVGLAKELLESAGDQLVLPVDHLVATELAANATTKVVEEIPSGWIGVDIGPKTIEKFRAIVQNSATIVWNGPMGKFEDEPFRTGTKSVAQALADHGDITVVGGGESADAVEQFGLADKMTHVSTGGGAFLEYIEGKPFAPLSLIDDA